jgi:S1-C subfamily serine protease
MSSDDLLGDLRAALEALDRPGAGLVCDELIRSIESGDDAPVRSAKAALSALRGRRYFDEMCRLGAALTLEVRDPGILRLYAQGLIEENHLAQAAELLRGMVLDPATPSAEVTEARGLLGRVFKQRYVGLPDASPTKRRERLLASLEQYRAVFDDTPDELWHGVNVVALLARAERDEVDVGPSEDFREIARRILHAVEDREQENRESTWDFATAMEAAIALGEAEVAVRYADLYVQRAVKGGANQFEYASTLRQLREVWGATPDDFVGRTIVPLLEAVLLDVAVRTNERGSATMRAETLELLGTDEGIARFEKVFDETDRYKRMDWFEKMRRRALAIGKVKQPDGRGVGTGFLVRGSDLCDRLDDEWCFVTNSHVVSDDEAVRRLFSAEQRPLLPAEASVQFEMLFRREKPKLRLGEIVWSSPPAALDVTVVRLGEPFYDDEVEPYPIGEEFPDPAARPRLYILGHPNGSELSVSLHDNHLIERDDRLCRYRTPTNPGSSGSPVFDDQWRLVGLHHAGSQSLPGLEDPSTVTEANEGIRIDAIVRALRDFLSGVVGSTAGPVGAD